jgi:hypothetical protein
MALQASPKPTKGTIPQPMLAGCWQDTTHNMLLNMPCSSMAQQSCTIHTASQRAISRTRTSSVNDRLTHRHCRTMTLRSRCQAYTAHATLPTAACSIIPYSLPHRLIAGLAAGHKALWQLAAKHTGCCCCCFVSNIAADPPVACTEHQHKRYNPPYWYIPSVPPHSRSI